MAIKLIINNTDFSAYIQQETDITEKMRKIYGQAQATALDGTTIPNLVAVKYDPSFRMKPLPQSLAARLLNMMEAETVTLKYTSWKVAGSGTRSITAFPVSMTVSYATTDYNGNRVYAPTEIAFEEQ